MTIESETEKIFKKYFISACHIIFKQEQVQPVSLSAFFKYTYLKAYKDSEHPIVIGTSLGSLIGIYSVLGAGLSFWEGVSRVGSGATVGGLTGAAITCTYTALDTTNKQLDNFRAVCRQRCTYSKNLKDPHICYNCVKLQKSEFASQADLSLSMNGINPFISPNVNDNPIDFL